VTIDVFESTSEDPFGESGFMPSSREFDRAGRFRGRTALFPRPRCALTPSFDNTRVSGSAVLPCDGLKRTRSMRGLGSYPAEDQRTELANRSEVERPNGGSRSHWVSVRAAWRCFMNHADSESARTDRVRRAQVNRNRLIHLHSSSFCAMPLRSVSRVTTISGCRRGYP
jgi:hypothetical protein